MDGRRVEAGGGRFDGSTRRRRAPAPALRRTDLQRRGTSAMRFARNSPLRWALRRWPVFRRGRKSCAREGSWRSRAHAALMCRAVSMLSPRTLRAGGGAVPVTSSAFRRPTIRNDRNATVREGADLVGEPCDVDRGLETKRSRTPSGLGDPEPRNVAARGRAGAASA
jgi:hypothetical protein